MNWTEPKTRPRRNIFDSICDAILEFQRAGHYDWKYI